MLFTEQMKQDYLKLCEQVEENKAPEIKVFGEDGRHTIEFLRSMGLDRDENGKVYTPLTLPDNAPPIDKSKLTGITAPTIEFVYGDKE